MGVYCGLFTFVIIWLTCLVLFECYQIILYFIISDTRIELNVWSPDYACITDVSSNLLLILLLFV